MRTLLVALAALLAVTLATPTHMFDYVIVGQGVGGLVAANRLSANPHVTVLLIDKGPVQCAACDLSIGAQADVSAYNQHSLFPLPQPFAALLRSPPHIQYSGKGGNSKIYGCVATRPSRELLNTYYPVGFKYNDLLPYFKKNENHYCHYLPQSYTGISAGNCTALHGKGGNQDVSPQAVNELSPQIHSLVAYCNATTSLGFKGDYNNPDEILGCHYEQAYRRSADRTDPYSARSRMDAQIGFMNATISARPNVKFINDAIVTKLVINPFTKRVLAVKYLVNGTQEGTAGARKRVVVSAGALGTPQLLQVSGIGPAGFLSDAGITPLVINDNIGTSLQSHTAVILGYRTKEVVVHNASMSSYNSLQLFLNTGLQSTLPADVQVELLEGFYVESVDGSANGLPVPLVDAFLKLETQFPFLSPEVELHNTAAVGFVKAVTPDMADPPQWSLGWDFATFFGGDLARLQAALVKVRAIFKDNNTFTFAHIDKEIYPGTQFLNQLTEMGYNDTSAMAAFGMNLHDLADFFFFQARVTHFYHIAATVPLGVATNLLGEVNGVKGIVVADASILPHNPDGNPSTTIAAVVRKLADTWIQADFPNYPLYP